MDILSTAMPALGEAISLILQPQQMAYLVMGLIMAGLFRSLKDAVLLSACPQASLSYTTDAGTYLLGARTPYSLALSLIPLAP